MATYAGVVPEVHAFPKDTAGGHFSILGVDPKTGRLLGWFYSPDIDDVFENIEAKIKVQLYSYNRLTERWKIILNFTWPNDPVKAISADLWTDLHDGQRPHSWLTVRACLHPSWDTVGFTLNVARLNGDVDLEADMEEQDDFLNQVATVFVLVDLTKTGCPFEIFCLKDSCALIRSLHFISAIDSWVALSDERDPTIWSLNLRQGDSGDPRGFGEVSFTRITELIECPDFGLAASSFSESGVVSCIRSLGPDNIFAVFSFLTNGWVKYALHASEETKNLMMTEEMMRLHYMGNNRFLADAGNVDEYFPYLKFAQDDQLKYFTAEKVGETLYPLQVVSYKGRRAEYPSITDSYMGVYDSGCMFQQVWDLPPPVTDNENPEDQIPLENDLWRDFAENDSWGFISIEVEKTLDTLEWMAVKSLVDHIPGLKEMNEDQIRAGTGLPGPVIKKFFV